MITEMEQATLDIDWFFTDGKYVSFMASGGGKLPESIAKSKENNDILFSYFRKLPERSDVVVNPKLNDLLIEIFGTGADERYLQDFIFMTKKGLYSFDKTNLNNFFDYDYHLVTSPKNPLTISELPKNILDILMETKYPDIMCSVINVGKIN